MALFIHKGPMGSGKTKGIFNKIDPKKTIFFYHELYPNDHSPKRMCIEGQKKAANGFSSPLDDILLIEGEDILTHFLKLKLGETNFKQENINKNFEHIVVPSLNLMELSMIGDVDKEHKNTLTSPYLFSRLRRLLDNAKKLHINVHLQGFPSFAEGVICNLYSEVETHFRCRWQLIEYKINCEDSLCTQRNTAQSVLYKLTVPEEETSTIVKMDFCLVHDGMSASELFDVIIRKYVRHAKSRIQLDAFLKKKNPKETSVVVGGKGYFYLVSTMNHLFATQEVRKILTLCNASDVCLEENWNGIIDYGLYKKEEEPSFKCAQCGITFHMMIQLNNLDSAFVIHLDKLRYYLNQLK